MPKQNGAVSPDSLTDPRTGQALKPREQPGYYPKLNTLSQQKYWDAATRDVVMKRVHGGEKPLRFFTEAEANTLRAVADRILPQDDRVPERRISLLASIDDRLAANRIDGYRYEDMPSDQEAYRLAARAFELMAQRLRGRSFHELSPTDQDMLVKSIHDASPAEAREEWSKMNVERFWSMLAGDVCSVYYSHPWAWDEVGFGGPAYPRGYMRLEEGEPEPWESRERRYAWKAPGHALSDVEESHGSGQQHQQAVGEGGTH